jgi:hypothetical protein
LGVALRKQQFVEEDNSHRSYSNSNTKDCKRRNSMASRPSAAVKRSGSVRAAIKIFEQKTTLTPSTKKYLVVSEDRGKPAENWSTDESTKPLESAEAKKQPKYPTAKFKREATLLHVNLDCEEVCNGDRTAQKCDGNVNGQRKQRTAEFLSNISEEEHDNFLVENDRSLKSYSDQAKSGQNSTVFTVTEGSQRRKTELDQTKTKPVVPIKRVTKQQMNTSVPFFKHNSGDSHCVNETCKSGNICDSARNTGMDENNSVRHDNFSCLQNSSAMSESSVKKFHTTQGREKLQKGDKGSMAPTRPYSLPRTNQFMSVRGTKHSTSTAGSNQTTSLPGTDQMTSVPGTSSKHPYSVIQPQDDEVYHDVGPPINLVKQCTRSATSEAKFR